MSKEQCARKHLPNLKRRRRDAVIPSTGQMTAGGFAGGRYFATTQEKIQRTLLIATYYGGIGRVAEHQDRHRARNRNGRSVLNRTGTQFDCASTSSGQRRSARPITSRRFARFLRQTDEAGDENPDIDLSGMTLIPLGGRGRAGARWVEMMERVPPQVVTGLATR